MDEAYKEVWRKKISGNVTFVEENAVNTAEFTELLSYEKDTTPLVHRSKIVIYTNGIITYHFGGFTVGEESFMGKLDDVLLHEIRRLMESDALQNEKSCTELMMDGMYSTLTLETERGMKLISNLNCKKNKFSFEYQCLLYLISVITEELRLLK